MTPAERRTDPRPPRSVAWLAPLRRGALGLSVALLLPAAVRADQPPPPAADDLDVIEFIGSVGSDDADWLKYLAQTDPAAAASVPTSGPPASGPPGNGSPKSD